MTSMLKEYLKKHKMGKWITSTTKLSSEAFRVRPGINKHSTMKFILIIFLVGLSPVKSLSQAESGLYKGLERMCWTNNKGKVECYDAPRKWYHENTLLIDKDSLFIFKVPVQKVGNKIFYSASDGAFYYLFGTIQQIDTGTIVRLTMNNCDYCAQEITIDTATGFMYPVPKVENFKLTVVPNGIKIGNTVYSKIAQIKNHFPPRQMFYFDSNSIYREDPKEQYNLISTGIKSFLQTRELKLDNDTLRICIERFRDVDMLGHYSLIETLNPEKINIDTTGIYFKYYKKDELKKMTANSKYPVRYIEIKQIIDYWKAARVSLEYVISLPKSLHNFSERQLNNVFEYKKIGTEYKLIDKLPENNWGLIEQR
jgi:hypothetical protein